MSRPAAPGLVPATALVARPGLREFVTGRGILGVGLVILFAAGIAFLVNRESGEPPAENLQALQMVLLSTVVVPLIALLLGTSAMATERENGTLPYLFTRPIRRASVAIGKSLAAVGVAVVATTVCVLVVYAASGAPADAGLGGGLIALLLEAVALTAVFALFGTVFARSLYVGLAYAALYEGFLGNVLLPENEYSVGYHARNLLYEWSSNHLRDAPFHNPTESVTVSIVALAVTTLAAFAGAAAWVETREYGLRDRPKEE